ncbi:hypothetical protein [Leifsonia poae]|uniref:hypothetical protein n=1 Tax=Leifsonia poae TaxID=110933 RepID=UPI001CBA717A|nr:hypothetical protein [Leifsonia poae]
MTTAREVRDVHFRTPDATFLHLSRALAHEALPAGVMVWAIAAGNSAAATTAAALTLALLSFAYAPLARTRHWAREHLADLWAMLLLMAVMAVSSPSASDAGSTGSSEGMSGHRMGMGALSAGISMAAAFAVVAVWVLARVLLARRLWRFHSLASAAVCGAGLLWMLAL